MLTKLILSGCFSGLLAHMEMTAPRIPNSQYDHSLKWFDKVYTNIFPIGNEYYQDVEFCHQNMELAKPLDSINAGTNYTTKFKGDAPHDGGHCEFSLSYDGKNFAVIHTVISECLRKSNTIIIKVPATAPSGTATLSWTWVNRIGMRELYMNCAKINVVGGPKSGSVSGPKRLIANLPGYPTIHQFKYSTKGVYLYRNRTTITTGLDQKGNPTFKETDNKSVPSLSGQTYFYDPLQPQLDPTKGFPDKGTNEDLDD